MSFWETVGLVLGCLALIPTLTYCVMYYASLGWHAAKYRSFHRQVADKV